MRIKIHNQNMYASTTLKYFSHQRVSIAHKHVKTSSMPRPQLPILMANRERRVASCHPAARSGAPHSPASSNCRRPQEAEDKAPHSSAPQVEEAAGMPKVTVRYVRHTPARFGSLHTNRNYSYHHRHHRCSSFLLRDPGDGDGRRSFRSSRPRSRTGPAAASADGEVRSGLRIRTEEACCYDHGCGSTSHRHRHCRCGRRRSAGCSSGLRRSKLHECRRGAQRRALPLAQLVLVVFVVAAAGAGRRRRNNSQGTLCGFYSLGGHRRLGF